MLGWELKTHAAQYGVQEVHARLFRNRDIVTALTDFGVYSQQWEQSGISAAAAVQMLV